jgi:redox-sensitive bicupin YhaK (pirin superfamily)
MNTRCVQILMRAVETSDGAGVRIRRSLGSTPGALLDPFLMLDAFGSDDAADYIAGFPPHPHRSFETVTYMLDLDVHLDPDGGFALPIDPAQRAGDRAGATRLP